MSSKGTKETEYNGENTRQFYRVEYPETESPVLHAAGYELHAINVSEKGGKFLNKGEKQLNCGDRVLGKITFSDGKSLPVEGEVLKVFDKEVVICFSKGLPYSRIIKEQRLLMNKFRHVFID